MAVKKSGPRPITIGMPSRTLKMTIWEGTEDAETLPIKGMKSKKPYVYYAPGRQKFYLTDEEIKIARAMSSGFGALMDVIGK